VNSNEQKEDRLTATHTAQELPYEYFSLDKISHTSDFLWWVGRSIKSVHPHTKPSISFQYLLNSLLMKQVTKIVVAKTKG